MRSIAKKLTEWYGNNARDLPWRRTRDAYAIWISEIMLQQTQVKTVIPYFERWMRIFPTVGAFARAPLETVLKQWEGLGYYKRVRNAQTAACQILERHGGRFPAAFEDVLALPGVGRYTAGAICSLAFNQPAPILDGNVIRVLSRLFGISGNPRDKRVNQKLWSLAQALVSVRGIEPSQLNQALMELGALICLPRLAKCSECPVSGQCQALAAHRVAELPALASRAPARQRRFIALVVRQRGRFLVRPRPTEGVNAGLWEFPNVEIPLKTRGLAAFAAPFSIAPGGPIFHVRHSITNSRILLEVFRATLSARTEPPGVWKTAAEARKLPFTSAHRKVLEAVANGPCKNSFLVPGNSPDRSQLKTDH
ncbi:MAG: A/G-specific adenine glycosylase [Limisphaerales bacterium]